MSEAPRDGEQWRRWEAPTVGESRSASRTSQRKGSQSDAASRDKPESSGGRGSNAHVTASEIESIQEAAYREAYDKGYQDGISAGEADIKRHVEKLTGILNALAQPLEAVDHQVEQELSDLVCLVARQLIRREIRTDPGQIVAAVREAVNALPSGERQVTVQLHPEDAALIREVTGQKADSPWELLEDPTLSRGGCVVSDRNSRVDMRLEQQIGRVLAGMLGEERDVPDEDSVVFTDSRSQEHEVSEPEEGERNAGGDVGDDSSRASADVPEEGNDQEP